MSLTIAVVDRKKCVCGNPLKDVYVDMSDCDDDAGLCLKQGDAWIDLTPQMVADLVDALVSYQNPDGVK